MGLYKAFIYLLTYWVIMIIGYNDDTEVGRCRGMTILGINYNDNGYDDIWYDDTWFNDDTGHTDGTWV